jgi:hypothetical protein
MAVAWRERMPGALNGTWSNHSGFLAQALVEEMPASVRVEPESSFFPFPATPEGLRRLLVDDEPVPADALSTHLWAHLWWDPERTDYSSMSALDLTESHVRTTGSTFARLARPFLPPPIEW